MRNISVDDIKDTVARLCWEACYHLPADIVDGFKKAEKTEESSIGKKILNQLIENSQMASTEGISYCQDTGLTGVYVDVGQDVHLVGGDFEEAVQDGVREGYKDGYLRNSVVRDPLLRTNTGDNTPAVIHTNIVSGDEVKITVLPKGGGGENFSTIKFLLPGEGEKGIKQFVIDTLIEAGGKACPPFVVGVGLGGSFEKAPAIAKEATMRDINVRHPEPHIAKLEKELLEEVNKTGIGPQGMGGLNTALGVAIETYACHISIIPVAVNIQCHAARKKTAII